MLQHLGPQVLRARRQINGGRLDVAVAHHFRERENVAPSLKHKCGKGVSERVDVKAQARDASRGEDQMLESLRSQPHVSVERRKYLRAGLAQPTTILKVPLKNTRERRAHRNDTVLAALPLPNED